MRTRRIVRGATVVALALSTAGCAGAAAGEADGPPTTGEPTTTAAPPTTSAVADERAVLDAYQALWHTYEAVAEAPLDPGPGFEQVATGDALAAMEQRLDYLRNTKLVAGLPPDSRTEHRASVESIGGDSATVVDCAIDDGILYDSLTGEVWDDDVVTRLYRVTVVRTADGWRTSHLAIDAEWDGISGCDA